MTKLHSKRHRGLFFFCLSHRTDKLHLLPHMHDVTFTSIEIERKMGLVLGVRGRGWERAGVEVLKQCLLSSLVLRTQRSLSGLIT